MNEKAFVSIVTVTYNHEKYIRACLDGFLMQKTNFKFEVLIHDDASTDGTTEIIKEYEQKYPDIIKPVYETENQFSKGVSIYRTYNLPRVSGKYVAVCEGDDYWSDPYKLQKQVDFLEKNPDYSVCFHPTKVIFDGYENKKEYTEPNEKQIKNGFTYENLLKYNFIPANSVMYRWEFNDKNIWDVYPDGLFPGDWYAHLLHAKAGKIGYINEIMSVYRRHPGGLWSVTMGYPEKWYQKYPLQEIKFFDSVYKYITDCSDEYFTTRLIPELKKIHIALVKNEENAKLNQIFRTYPEYFEKICRDYYIEKENVTRQLLRLNAEFAQNKAKLVKTKAKKEILAQKLKKKKKELNLIKNKTNIFFSYYRYKLLSKILFGAKRVHYKQKAEDFHKKVRIIRKLK